MAEGHSEKKVYFMRHRKRSIEDAGKHSSSSEEDKKECKRSVESAGKCSEFVEKSELVSGGFVSDELVIDLAEGEVGKCNQNLLECAICLQNCVHPARLPCGHIFCFLCVKGAAHGNKKCAMCRNPIPHNYFQNPELVETPEEISDINHEGYQWFYEGRQGGWWQYEERMSKEIEDNYKNGVNQFETIICGRMYTVDLVTLVQFKSDFPGQRRRIVRDRPSNVSRRGIAGIV